MVYYNEIDPYAAQWLRNLISAGHIAKGDVDERSIKDVKPDDLRGYAQCHFFAGIGVWSYALRLAGWPDDRPVWTGSCPCQPFSAAGKGKGTADERHLWPVWFNLIRECRPDTVFGEQVEAAVKHGWLDLVQSDLEGEGYALAPVGIPAAGVGAPHIRQRLWFVADSNSIRHDRSGSRSAGRPESSDDVADGLLADSLHTGRTERWSIAGCGQASRDGGNGLLADALNPRSQGRLLGRSDSRRQGEWWPVEGLEQPSGGSIGQPIGDSRSADKQSATRPSYSQWQIADWLYCRDGKWRPVEPGTFPLAHGAAARVGRLRAYGNAIVPQVAQAFIRACKP